MLFSCQTVEGALETQKRKRNATERKNWGALYLKQGHCAPFDRDLPVTGRWYLIGFVYDCERQCLASQCPQ
jgi:hypothetical protein